MLFLRLLIQTNSTPIELKKHLGAVFRPFSFIRFPERDIIGHT
jgi:hypothetical protein